MQTEQIALLKEILNVQKETRDLLALLVEQGLAKLQAKGGGGPGPDEP